MKRTAYPALLAVCLAVPILPVAAPACQKQEPRKEEVQKEEPKKEEAAEKEATEPEDTDESVPDKPANAKKVEPSPEELMEEILESGSFEIPPVTSRKPRSIGGDPSKSGIGEWVTFQDKPDPEGGQVIMGLTNEISRSLRQSIFVEFNKLTKPLVSAQMSSEFIEILPAKKYKVSIWGRMDKKRPITLAQRLPYLRLRVDWFQEDKMTQTGNVVLKSQSIPGPKTRPPLFVSDKWKEYWAWVDSPDDAKYIKITWSWETPPQEGQTDGVIYFDDASLRGEPAPKEEAEDPDTTGEEKPAAGTAKPDGAKPAEAKSDGTKAGEAKPEQGKPAEPKEPRSSAPKTTPPPPTLPKKNPRIDATPLR
jgi:hypothetical protein